MGRPLVKGSPRVKNVISAWTVRPVTVLSGGVAVAESLTVQTTHDQRFAAAHSGAPEARTEEVSPLPRSAPPVSAAGGYLSACLLSRR